MVKRSGKSGGKAQHLFYDPHPPKRLRPLPTQELRWNPVGSSPRDRQWHSELTNGGLHKGKHRRTEMGCKMWCDHI